MPTRGLGRPGLDEVFILVGLQLQNDVFYALFGVVHQDVDGFSGIESRVGQVGSAFFVERCGKPLLILAELYAHTAIGLLCVVNEAHVIVEC